MGRIEKLRESLQPGFGAALLFSDFNRTYFSQFPSSEGWLVVTESEAFLLVDFRYIEAAKKQAKGATVVLAKAWKKQLKEILESAGAKTALVEGEIPLWQYEEIQQALPGVEVVYNRALSDAAKKIRQIKEPQEIEAIKSAQAITDTAFTEILNFIKPGITERALAAELEYIMRKLGSDGTAFSTIAVSGANTSKPHGVPSDKVIARGDFVTMDYGAAKHNYCSDMTRTVAVGEVSDAQRAVYEKVLEAHLAAMAAAKPGITGIELDKIARDIIAAAGHAEHFGHGLGHSLGLEIHEEPRANTVCGDALLPGMLMTIEPGIYLPGEFGVRIENMILITDEGYENLTASERKLLVV